MSSKSEINRLKNRKRIIENGGINCIPCPFPRFSNVWPGLTWKRYYLISGGSKAAKSQFASNVFLYNSILYAFYNPDKIKLKIRYYPLEEDKDTVVDRFICFLLKTLGNKRIDTAKLESLETPLSEDILELLDSEDYSEILDFFLDTVKFVYKSTADEIRDDIDKFAEENGILEKSEEGSLLKYTPNDSKTLLMTYTDHVGMLQTNGESLKSAIDRLDKKYVESRNICYMTHVVVQQQNQQSASLDSYKLGKIEPTLMGLADSTNTGKSCDIMFGIVNPYYWELNEYIGYKIKDGLRDNCRFIKVVLARKDVSAPGSYLSLFFDGACAIMKELPRPGNTAEINRIYNYCKTLMPQIQSDSDSNAVNSIVMTILSKLHIK